MYKYLYQPLPFNYSGAKQISLLRNLIDDNFLPTVKAAVVWTGAIYSLDHQSFFQILTFGVFDQSQYAHDAPCLEYLSRP